MTTFADDHFDGKRPPFSHTYVGKFNDRNGEIRTVTFLLNFFKFLFK